MNRCVMQCFLFLSGSIHEQLAGIIPQRDCYEPDLTAEARGIGPIQPTAAYKSLPVQLQSRLEQLQPATILEHRMPYG